MTEAERQATNRFDTECLQMQRERQAENASKNQFRTSWRRSADDTAATRRVLLLGPASSRWRVRVGLDGRLLLQLDRLGWWWNGANDHVYHRSRTGLAATRGERELCVIQNVAEVEQSEIVGRFGSGLRPRLGPILPDLGSNRLDGVGGCKLPRLALASSEKRGEVNGCGC